MELVAELESLLQLGARAERHDQKPGLAEAFTE